MPGPGPDCTENNVSSFSYVPPLPFPLKWWDGWEQGSLCPKSGSLNVKCYCGSLSHLLVGSTNIGQEGKKQNKTVNHRHCLWWKHACCYLEQSRWLHAHSSLGCYPGVQWPKQVSKCTKSSIYLPVIKDKGRFHLNSQSLDQTVRRSSICCLWRLKWQVKLSKVNT